MSVLYLTLLATVGAAEIRGVVIGPDSEPVQDVWIVGYDHRLNYAQTTTSEEGEFLLNLPGVSQVRLHAIPDQGSGLAEELGMGEWDYCSAHTYRDGSEVVWPLRQAGALSGQLGETEASPLVGATVTAIPVLSSDLPRIYTTTDEDGYFSLSGLHPGVGGVRLQVDSDDVPRQFVGLSYDEDQGQIVALLEGGLTELGFNTTLPGVVVGGEIRGPEGLVSGAEVRAYSPSQVRSTISSDGKYSIQGLPPGEALAWASAAGLATTYYPDADRPGDRVNVEEGQQFEQLHLELPPEARVHGHLSSSAPIDGAAVLLYNDTRTVGVGAEVDSDGRFEIGGLHAGDYTLEVYASAAGLVDDWWRDDAGEPAVIRVADASVTEVSVELPAGSSLSFEARDRYTNRPIEGVVIRAVNVDSGRLRSVTADAEGLGAAQGLPPGDWTLSATYSPFCTGDPNWVDVYYPDSRAEDQVQPLRVDAGGETHWAVFLAPDNDYDAMDDVWESSVGLDPNRNDAGEDPDGDGLTNLQEYRANSDPFFNGDGSGCGCRKENPRSAYVFVPMLCFPAFRRRRRR